jgi:D-alanyl-D-alanine dipeptidase
MLNLGVVDLTMQAAIALLLLLLTSFSAQAQTTPAEFIDAATVVDGLVVDMRYFGADNFVGTRIDGYEAPRCLLTRRAAVALSAAQRDLARRGLGLKVLDCYRPTRAVAHFARWARNLADVARKADYYPDVEKRDLFRLGYIAERSGHSRGSTVDITLVRRAAGSDPDVGMPDLGTPDMGTRFDFFSPKSWPGDISVGKTARRNRALLAAAMARAGFQAYDKEWWHFTLRNEPFPASYFDFPVR